MIASFTFIIKQGARVYWLIVGLILVAMIGVLAVADSIPMSLDSFLSGLTSPSSLFLLLTMLSIILVAVLLSYAEKTIEPNLVN